jgi:DNA-binding response OmpR family regulator
MPVVFIVSGEWDLRGAVRAELREAGIDALGMESVEDMARMIASGIVPSVVILDSEQLHRRKMREAVQSLSSRVKVLMIASQLNPEPPLPGAITIMRPVQLKEIVARILAVLSTPHAS